MNSPLPLPYTDSKPVGAADFYMAINATFRFIMRRFGAEGLRRYWTDLGSRYYSPVSALWKAGGFPAVASHWRAFFDAEPGAEVRVCEGEAHVTVEVRVCPAIRHLRNNGREIVPSFCQQCYYVHEAIAAPAGFTARLEGGNGSCRQTFYRRDAGVAAQDPGRIQEVVSC
jgi:hypothetical protein